MFLVFISPVIHNRWRIVKASWYCANLEKKSFEMNEISLAYASDGVYIEGMKQQKQTMKSIFKNIREAEQIRRQNKVTTIKRKSRAMKLSKELARTLYNLYGPRGSDCLVSKHQIHRMAVCRELQNQGLVNIEETRTVGLFRIKRTLGTGIVVD